MTKDHNEDFDAAGQATRNIGLLSVAQAMSGSSQSIIISSAALAGAAFSPDPKLDTLPVTSMMIGLALTASIATFTIYRLGRKRGFILGALLGAVGGLIAGLAVAQMNFILFCIGLAIAGMSAAFGQQVRFAAADSVPEAMKPRAISFVLLGGVLAGVLGPTLAGLGQYMIPAAEYAGTFFMITGVAAVAVLVLSFTRLAPVVRREKGAQRQGRSIIQLLRSPEIFVPIITGLTSYSLMTFVMVAAPLAMVHVCGLPASDARFAIQWHIISMFAPSLITGEIIKRLGAHLTTGIGLVLILLCAAVALNGITTWHFDAALILLGVGWNFGFIGSTTLLSQAYRPEEAALAQGLNEQLVFGAMALASIGSGVMLQLIGWQSINVMVLPIATAAIALLAWGEARTRAARRAS